MTSVLVTGAGGFIGGHLVARLREQGVEHIRGVDRVPLGRVVPALRRCRQPERRPAGPGGLPERLRGHRHRVQPRRRHGRHGVHREQQGAVHAVGADLHPHAGGGPPGRGAAVLLFLVGLRLRRRKQESPEVEPLRESDAYPAMPEDGYGWEKLFSERMARHYYEDFGLETRVARYHNVYGPYGTYDGGREKAPAAICRKVATAVLDGSEDDRDLGRREADAQLHLHRRLRGGHAAADRQRRARAAQRRLRATGHDQRAGRHRRGHRRVSRSSATTTCRRPRACGAATATTR